MNWEEEVALELQRARQAWDAGNAGRARTACRRAVGIALTELYRRESRPLSNDFITLIREFVSRENVPEEVRAAGERLTARLAADFSSASTDPVNDAEILIGCVKQLRG